MKISARLRCFEVYVECSCELKRRISASAVLQLQGLSTVVIQVTLNFFLLCKGLGFEVVSGEKGLSDFQEHTEKPTVSGMCSLCCKPAMGGFYLRA